MTVTEHGLQPDVRIEAYGSLYLVTARSTRAKYWVIENTEDDAIYCGPALVVQGEYFEALFDELVDAGFRIS